MLHVHDFLGLGWVDIPIDNIQSVENYGGMCYIHLIVAMTCGEHSCKHDLLMVEQSADEVNNMMEAYKFNYELHELLHEET